MRDIRFRAFDKNGDGMFYNIETGIQFDDGSHYTFDKFLNPDADDIHEWEIMQSTGLHDKNGKEMYEGDICRIHFYHDKTSVVGVMEWLSDASFCIRADTIYSPRFRSGGDFGDYPAVEVIGNIHEHPHLIKKQ